jgi:prepilin-type N-terminal cleavage/methylation domain-containing protein
MIKQIPKRLNKKRLIKIAEQQHGYFTTAQAVLCDYIESNHSYHVKQGNWKKLSKGLFRLSDYSDSMESEFCRWCLWSRNQAGQPQGIISYDSALAFHGFSEYKVGEINLTVPMTFRKLPPPELKIHKASLTLSAIESHDSFMVTRLGQTLLDMRKELEAKGEWDGIIEKVVVEGRLPHEDAINLGFVTSSKMVSDSNLSLEPSSRQESLDVFKQNTEQIEAQLSKGRIYDPVSEGVWKMMSERAEFGRRASKAGFTLVELLLVVAILSILAGLLLPMAGRALKAARGISCLNNLRQCASAEHMYADDYKDYLPPAALPGSTSWRTFHLAVIVNYLQVAKETMQAKQGPQICPSFVNPFTYDTPEMRLWFRPSATNEIYYSYPGTRYMNAADIFVTNPARRARVANPSETLLLSDGRSTTTDFWTQSFYVIHNNCFNAAWLDGHTTSVKTPWPDETKISDLASPDRFFYQNTNASLPPWSKQ